MPASLRRLLAGTLLLAGALAAATPLGEGPAWAAAAPGVSGQLYTAAGMTPSDKPRDAPEFSLPALNGSLVRLSDYRGKLVVLNFWATWCRPCIKEMPSLERLSNHMQGRNLVVLAISLDRDPAAHVSMFVEGYGWKLPVLLDPEASAGDAYLVSGMPSTFLIGPDGMILGRAVGAHEWDGAAPLALFNALLASEATASASPM
ncbi:MAG: TlpA family protein disulfide reductase [Nitrospirota bacterium]|nr:TlpA family protein disulfide reductase [Nitrospirota bacterium]